MSVKDELFLNLFETKLNLKETDGYAFGISDKNDLLRFEYFCIVYYFSCVSQFQSWFCWLMIEESSY